MEDIQFRIRVWSVAVKGVAAIHRHRRRLLMFKGDGPVVTDCSLPNPRIFRGEVGQHGIRLVHSTVPFLGGCYFVSDFIFSK